MDLITPDLLIRWLGGLLAIAGLLLAFLATLKWWQARGGTLPGTGEVKNKRLRVLETRLIDGKHRAVLLACDTEEHLIILGGQSPVQLSHTKGKKGA